MLISLFAIHGMSKKIRTISRNATFAENNRIRRSRVTWALSIIVKRSSKAYYVTRRGANDREIMLNRRKYRRSVKQSTRDSKVAIET